MDGAFQSVLERVGELGLNDGDFLRMNTLLKKAYDESKKPIKPAAVYPIVLTHTAEQFGEIYIALHDKDEDEFIRYTLLSVTHTRNEVIEDGRHTYPTSFKVKWKVRKDGGHESEFEYNPRHGEIYSHLSWIYPIKCAALLTSAQYITVSNPYITHMFAFHFVITSMRESQKKEYEANTPDDTEDWDGRECHLDHEDALRWIFRRIEEDVMIPIKHAFPISQ